MSGAGVRQGARQAVAFLTPFGGAATPTPAAVGWFPVVGGAVGAALGLVWWGASHAWPAAVAAAVVVVADLVVTGMLHLDGVVDAADGLLPHLDRARRLAVMREPTVGAFGIAAGGACLLLRWAALFTLRPSVLLLAGLWAGSRGAMGAVTVIVPYARAGGADGGAGGGLASAFLPPPGNGPGGGADVGSGAGRVGGPGVKELDPGAGGGGSAAGGGAGSDGEGGAGGSGVGGRRASRPGVVAGAVGLAMAVSLVLAWDPLSGAVSLACGVAAAAGVVWLAVRRLGGFTGDVLGASGVVLETVALVVAAARW